MMLKKAREQQHWGSLLKLEKDKEKSKLVGRSGSEFRNVFLRMPKMDESSDPQESLMHMMKQMYDDGDDEMKRTIRKAWHQAQSKKESGLDSNDIGM